MEFNRSTEMDVDNSQAIGKLLRLYVHGIQVEKLRIDFSHYNVQNEFVKLLWSQYDLKTLELAGFENIIYKSLFEHDISYMIMFELKRLILNHRVTYCENFLKFIQCLETLESIEIHREIETQEFFNTIFQMNIKSLTLATNFVTLKNIDFKRISKSQIEEVVLITKMQYGIEHTINYLIEKLNKLKTLKVLNLKTDSSDQMLACIHLKTLENLHVENSKLKFFQNIRFDCLKNLHLSSVHPYLKFEDWENFFKNNQHLETLIINDFEVYCVIENVKMEIEKIINNIHHVQRTLKYLKIFQNLRYQTPIKVKMSITNEIKVLKASDSFIKICRPEFHLMRKLHNFTLQYYADEHFRINNKYLTEAYY
jgi:hypothetical protein